MHTSRRYSVQGLGSANRFDLSRAPTTVVPNQSKEQVRMIARRRRSDRGVLLGHRGDLRACIYTQLFLIPDLFICRCSHLE